MAALDLKKKAHKFIQSLPPKHKRQVKDRILSLQDDPIPHDAKKLLGYENYIRIDVGEYHVVYRYDSKKDLVIIVLVGKRNDSEVYRISKRTLG
jgi:mRNA interferase RelE/StbE